MTFQSRTISKVIIALLLTIFVGFLAIDTAPAQAGTITFSGPSITTSNTQHGFCSGVPIYGVAHAFNVSTTGIYTFSSPNYTSGSFMWVSVHTTPNPADIFNDRLMGMWVYPNLSFGQDNPVNMQLVAGQTYYAIFSGDVTGACYSNSGGYPISNYSAIITGPGTIVNGPAPTPQTYTINGDDQNALYNAIVSANANPGRDTIQIGWLIFVNGLNMPPITEDITIVGMGSIQTIHTLASTNPIFNFASGVTASITNIRFAGHPSAAPVIVNTGATVTIDGSAFDSNTRALVNSGNTTVSNTTFSNNTNGCSGTITDGGGNISTTSAGCPDSTPPVSITVTSPIAGTINESASTTFTIGLSAAPTSQVEVVLSVNNGSQCNINGQATTTYYFNNANAQNVTINGVADGIYDANFTCAITIGTATQAAGSQEFNGVTPSQTAFNVQINNVDPAPTVTITPPISTTINEGTTTTFTMALNSAPVSQVSIVISSSDAGECRLNGQTTTTMYFDNANPTQQVTLSGEADNAVDGNSACNITINNAVQAGGQFDGVAPSITMINMTINDVDVAGINVSAPVSATVAEGGNTTFNVALTANPASNVTIPLTVSDPSECSVNPTSLTLANTTAATVTINGLIDNMVDGAQNCTVLLGTATGPGGYNTFDANDVAVSITDGDIANTNETLAPVQISESGNTTATFNLTSIPTATITATVSTSTADECTVTPATLTITDMSAQSLTITGVNDLMADGTQTCNVSVAFAGAAEYNVITYTASINVTDINTASFAIAPNTPVNIAEGGTQAYIFTLGSLPTAAVSFGVSTANGQCTVAPATVTLDSINWNTGVSVTVTGTAENITDGNQGCDLITANATGAGEYAGMNPPDATITILDDDTASYNATTAVVSLLEGDSGTATLRLSTAPDADVNFTFSTANATVCVISSATTHTFNAGNYNAPFTVAFQAPTDGITDGPQTCTLQYAATTTATGYNGLANPANMTFTVTDIDSPNLNVTPFTPTTIIEGAVGSYTVALTTQPDADVTLNFAPADPAVCTVTSAASHTFSSVTYGNAFTVIAQAVDNGLVDGTRTCTIQTTITSTATGYSLLLPADNTVSVADNDTAGIVINLGDDGDDNVFTQVIELVLQTQPAPGEIVMIDFRNLPPGIVVTPNPYIFDETNWNIPIIITIVIDENFNGDINEALMITIDSNSPEYSGIPPFNLSSVNIIIELVAPPPPPSLNEWMGAYDENRGHAYGMPDNAYGTIHMWNGAWQYNAGGVPQELIDYGVIFAVDVWMLTPDGQPQFDFGDGYEKVCLQGEGRLIFFDATTSPRQMTEILPVTFEDGYTCGWIPNAGTLVLIDPE